VSEERACPFCAETIKAAAVVCKHCGRDLPAAPVPDKPLYVARYEAPPEPDPDGVQWKPRPDPMPMVMGSMLVLVLLCGFMSVMSVGGTTTPAAVVEPSAATETTPPPPAPEARPKAPAPWDYSPQDRTSYRISAPQDIRGVAIHHGMLVDCVDGKRAVLLQVEGGINSFTVKSFGSDGLLIDELKIDATTAEYKAGTWIGTKDPAVLTDFVRRADGGWIRAFNWSDHWGKKVEANFDLEGLEAELARKCR
jgi:hypothetical protein